MTIEDQEEGADRARRATHVDLIVGRRLKQRRVELAMSQEGLGDLVGISFQQLQKYERGLNRVSAGRLFSFARALAVDANYFFDGLSFDPSAADECSTARSRSTMRLLAEVPDANVVLETFASIVSPRARRKAIELLRLLSKESVDAA